VAGGLLLAAAVHARAATLVIDDADPAGQGLNDLTPVAPVGGNTATTLGGQRLAVFNQAAALWGAHLPGTVPIHVSAQMAPLPCTNTGSVLASTGAGSVFRDFPSAPVPATWYPKAMADAIAGTDLAPGTPDIETTFNSAQGNPGCETGTTFYLGLDGHPGSKQIDMLTVLLHELAHGLGFQTFVDFSTGAKLNGLDDAYLLNIRQLGATPSALTAMTDQQRVAAAISDPDLYWTSPTVDGADSTFSDGLISGHVRLYGPATLSPGSSVSHYSNALTPNQLMEPFYTGPTRDLALTEDLLRDVGWSLAAPPPNVPALPPLGPALLALALGSLGLLRARRRADSLSSLGSRRASRPTVVPAGQPVGTHRSRESFPASTAELADRSCPETPMLFQITPPPDDRS
jgi:hypothetical protein